MTEGPELRASEVQKELLSDIARLKKQHDDVKTEAGLLEAKYGLTIHDDEDYVYAVLSALARLRINPFTNEVA